MSKQVDVNLVNARLMVKEADLSVTNSRSPVVPGEQGSKEYLQTMALAGVPIKMWAWCTAMLYVLYRVIFRPEVPLHGSQRLLMF